LPHTQINLDNVRYHIFGVFHGDEAHPPSDRYVLYVRDEIELIGNDVVFEQGLAGVFGYDPATEMRDQEFGTRWLQDYCAKRGPSTRQNRPHRLVNLLGNVEAFLQDYWTLAEEEHEFVEAAAHVVYEIPTKLPEMRDSYRRYVLPGELSMEEKAWYSFALCHGRKLHGLLTCIPLLPNRMKYMSDIMRHRGKQGCSDIVAVVGLAHEEDLSYALQNQNCNAYEITSRLFRHSVLL